MTYVNFKSNFKLADIYKLQATSRCFFNFHNQLLWIPTRTSLKKLLGGAFSNNCVLTFSKKELTWFWEACDEQTFFFTTSWKKEELEFDIKNSKLISLLFNFCVICLQSPSLLLLLLAIKIQQLLSSLDSPSKSRPKRPRYEAAKALNNFTLFPNHPRNSIKNFFRHFKTMSVLNNWMMPQALKGMDQKQYLSSNCTNWL